MSATVLRLTQWRRPILEVCTRCWREPSLGAALLGRCNGCGYRAPPELVDAHAGEIAAMVAAFSSGEDPLASDTLF
ncbi:hypothetical protein [Brevundimonas sp.]|uniref:hypothetical protein n=1 Tax=Brevundimonas sp. TaxID=1871086 RepID=UPI002D4F427C|nr:hypothetical protein [Brevundimonas sp.]HYD29216.1 hypothetical protein [Brevundimonas sp.]